MYAVMAEVTQENGDVIKCMAKVISNGMMVVDIKDNIN